MINLQTMNELAERLAKIVPNQAPAMQEDLTKSFHAILQASLARLNLVTREEFDVQMQVLLQTRRQLDALAKELQKREATPSTDCQNKPDANDKSSNITV